MARIENKVDIIRTRFTSVIALLFLVIALGGCASPAQPTVKPAGTGVNQFRGNIPGELMPKFEEVTLRRGEEKHVVFILTDRAVDEVGVSMRPYSEGNDLLSFDFLDVINVDRNQLWAVTLPAIDQEIIVSMGSENLHFYPNQRRYFISKSGRTFGEIIPVGPISQQVETMLVNNGE